MSDTSSGQPPIAEPLAPAAKPVRHWPALDGMRGVFVVVVFIFHCTGNASTGQGLPRGGWLSVDTFFVLSGFLITTLLLGEWDKRSSISFGNFYARRALRLFPILVVVLMAAIVAAFIFPQLAHSRHLTLAAVPWVLFYAGNWHRALSASGDNLGPFIHTWSLAVEEQFYLIWPTVLVLITKLGRRRSRVALVLAILAATETLWREALVHHGANLNRIYNGTDTHSDGLLLGAGLAFWLAAGNEAKLRLWVEKHLLRPATAIAVVALIVLVFVAPGDTPHGLVVGITLSNICTALIVWNLVVNPIHPVRWFLASRPAVWLGKRSYGLYLWQFILFNTTYFSFAGWGGSFGRNVVRVVLVFGLEALCFRYIETPALRLKSRFQKVEAMPAGVVPDKPDTPDKPNEAQEPQTNGKVDEPPLVERRPVSPVPDVGGPGG